MLKPAAGTGASDVPRDGIAICAIGNVRCSASPVGVQVTVGVAHNAPARQVPPGVRGASSLQPRSMSTEGGMDNKERLIKLIMLFPLT